jgi:hypothetical protein
VVAEAGAMIASWRALCVAAAIAVALAVIAALDVARTPTAVDRALLPGFDPARATALIWERPGQPAIRAERDGERWELRAPAVLPADAGAIGEVLAALRGARWHRQGSPPVPHATLTVMLSGERHVVGIAGAIAGGDQSWLIADGRGGVVDSWVARALDRDRLSLHVQRPLGELDAARTIHITGRITAPDGGGPGAAAFDLELAGWPRRLVAPHPLLLASSLDGILDRALRDLTIVRLPDSPPNPGHLVIRVAGGSISPITVALAGNCPGAPQLVAVTATTGDGCIERSAATAIEAAVAQLAQPPAAIVARSPLPFAPRHIVLPDGAALDTSPPRIATAAGDAAADSGRVIELLAALAASAEVVRLPSTPPIGHLVATDRDGTAVALDLFADRTLARHGEPVALRLEPGAWQLLTRPSRELRDLGLWLEEPTTITALTIDEVVYQRGGVIGTWTRGAPSTSGSAAPTARAGAPGSAASAAPATVDDARAKQVETLVSRLAAPRALGFTDQRFVVARRVAIDVTPPVGAPIHHALELGAPSAAGCPARAGGDSVVLPAALCTDIAALSAR